MKDYLRLCVLSPTLMRDLLTCGDVFPDKLDGQYLVIPVFLFNHPSLIQSRKSVVPDSKTLSHNEYQMALFNQLAHPPKKPFYDHVLKVPSEPVRLFLEKEEDPECKFEQAEVVLQVPTILVPIVQVPVKGKAKIWAEADWTDKEITHNDKKLKRDAIIDAMHPRYMYLFIPNWAIHTAIGI